MIAERKVWKRWRSAVRRRIKTSATLRRDYRRTRGHRIINHTWSRLRALAPLALAITLLSGEVPLSSILNLLLFWTVLVTFFRAQQIVGVFHNPPVLFLFFGWPVSDDEIFAHQRKLIFKSSLWLGVDWLVFGFALAFRTGDVGLALLTPLLAIGQWAAALGLALWLVRAWPRIPYTWLSIILGSVLFVMLRSRSGPNDMSPYLDALWHGLYVATPGGWLAQGWNNFSDGHPFGLTVIFGLSSAAVFAVVKGAQATRTAFNPEKLFGYAEAHADHREETHDIDEDDSEEYDSSLPENVATAEERRREITAIHREFARDHATDVLQAPAGRALSGRGSIEHAISWFLTPRQRALVDFMRPVGMPWLRRWLIACGLLLAAFVLNHTTTPIAAVAAVLVALCFALPLVGGRWQGFESLRLFQSQIGLSAYVPAGFGEIARLILKINALKCLAALPLVLVALHICMAIDNPTPAPDWVLDISVRLLALVLAAQPIWIIGKFSRNTNDSSGRWYFLVGLILVLIAALITGVSLIVTLFMVDSFWVAAGCLLGLNALTHTFLALYGLAWGRGWFDLIAKQK